MNPLLTPLFAMASPEADRWLSTDRVAIGIAEDGSLGNPAADLGLMFDPDGPKGAMPVGGEVLAVGRVFEVWSLSATVDGQPWSRVQAAPDGDSDLLLEPISGEPWEGYEVWQGEGGDEQVSVQVSHALPWGRAVAWTRVVITAEVDLQDLHVTRVFDPDLDDWATGSTSTINAVGEGVVVASGATDGRAWALAAAHEDGLAGTGGICRWCTSAEEVLAGGTEREGDDQLGLTVAVGDLAAGSQAEVVFAYGFGADADAAVAAAQAGALEDPAEQGAAADGGAEDSGLGTPPDPDELYGEDEAIPTEPTPISTGSRSCSTGVSGGLWLLLPALLRRRRS